MYYVSLAYYDRKKLMCNRGQKQSDSPNRKEPRRYGVKIQGEKREKSFLLARSYVGRKAV